MRLPDFIIIGAMKSATTTLYEQLSTQDGIFMPSVKEPNFFSDDDVYKKGLDWYLSLFRDAKEADLIGEASTHYTKLPTHPRTVSRLKAAINSPKLIYVVRDPIDRLVSQYVHEWTQGKITCDIDTAISKHPELIDYSRYDYQLAPYYDAFGSEAVLVIHFESLKESPEETLQSVCDFIGLERPIKWDFELKPQNVSSERLKKIPFQSIMIDSKLGTLIRQKLIPKSLRESIKNKLRMQKRPKLSEESIRFVRNKLTTSTEL